MTDPLGLPLIATLPVGTDVCPIQLIVPGDAQTSVEAELLLHAGSAFEIHDVDTTDPACVRVAGRWLTR